MKTNQDLSNDKKSERTQTPIQDIINMIPETNSTESVKVRSLKTSSAEKYKKNKNAYKLKQKISN